MAVVLTQRCKISLFLSCVSFSFISWAAVWFQNGSNNMYHQIILPFGFASACECSNLLCLVFRFLTWKLQEYWILGKHFIYSTYAALNSSKCQRIKNCYIVGSRATFSLLSTELFRHQNCCHKNSNFINHVSFQKYVVGNLLKIK